MATKSKPGPKPTPIGERFMDKVSMCQITGCWIWMGCLSKKYGRISRRHGLSPAQAHRVSYELHVGPIPDGMDLDHLCRHPWCVNPSHLEPVTTRENTLRGNSPAANYARRTTCSHGHPYSATLRWRRGRRECTICAKRWQDQSIANRRSKRRAESA